MRAMDNEIELPRTDPLTFWLPHLPCLMNSLPEFLTFILVGKNIWVVSNKFGLEL